MVIGRWSYDLREYEPYQPPEDWHIVLYTQDMDYEINCANCGKEMTFGQGYTSQELHNHFGLGFPVCEACYEDESVRRRKDRGRQV